MLVIAIRRGIYHQNFQTHSKWEEEKERFRTFENYPLFQQFTIKTEEEQ